MKAHKIMLETIFKPNKINECIQFHLIFPLLFLKYAPVAPSQNLCVCLAYENKQNHLFKQSAIITAVHLNRWFCFINMYLNYCNFLSHCYRQLHNLFA